MNREYKQFLEKQHGKSEWPRFANGSRRLIKDLEFDGSEVNGWTLERVRRDEHAKPLVIRSLWRRDETGNELLAIDLFVCPSVKAARDQLLEVLGDFQSGAVERNARKDTPGELAFALGDSMALFARINLVVLIRNAGPKVVSVRPASHAIDRLLLRWSKSSSSK